MRHAPFVMGLLAIPAAIACASTGPSTQTTQTTQEGKVVSPSTGLSVDVALASAHLGEEKCTHDESADPKPMKCGVPPPGAPKGTGPCGAPCDFSSIQLSFTADGGGSGAHVQIVGATILDASTGAELQKLTAYTPLVWKGTQYAAWDESLTPSSQVKASYTLSPPSWSTIASSSSYSRQYKVRVDLRIDGAPVSLQSEAISRDPPVAT